MATHAANFKGDNMYTVIYEWRQGSKIERANCGHKHKTITACFKCKKILDKIQLKECENESRIVRYENRYS